MELIGAVVLVVAVTVLFTLFIRPQDMPQPEAASPTRHLEDRKAVIYENLRDLQFEYRVGKLSDTDYQQTKVGLQRELAGVLAEIDKLAPVAAVAAVKPVAEVNVDTPAVEPGTVCPHCDAHFPKPMKFCGECGKAMA
jgi:rRNA maturation endonuclease Nob1